MVYKQFAPQSEQFTLNFQLTLLFPGLRIRLQMTALFFFRKGFRLTPQSAAPDGF